LKELFVNAEYNSRLFSILEDKILINIKETGRKGMDLWMIFVLAQTRLALNISYDTLHDLANNHTTFRQILGIETDFYFEKTKLKYQNIIDNISLLDEATLIKINDLIVLMGHDVFKKKKTEALHLKTDSFVLEGNIHFPTDYNLLWDSARKCISVVCKLISTYPETEGWRNIKYWFKTLKNQCREISQSVRKNENVRRELVEEYLEKAKLFLQKLKNEQSNLPLLIEKDLKKHLELDYYKQMLEKHINLLERRVIKGETIPQEEKIFSIFEPYTEWISKGKQHKKVELGKNIQITSDQFHLIVDFHIMEKESDSQTVIALADRVLPKYKVSSWSYDKGFYKRENKELLSLFINDLIMPKKGKLNKLEKEEEQKSLFKKLRNKHSAVESNINELENRGLDRCPDRGIKNFKRYVALGICAYNLHRIGAELRKQELNKLGTKKAA
jgi:transposase, IS5 family